MADNVIKDKSYKFALEIIGFCKILKEKKEYQLSDQLLRAGTSIGANVEEALSAQSRKDFVSKMSVAAKEAREANYWLRLILDSKIITSYKVKELIQESEEIKRILIKIVKTSSEE